MNLKLVLFNFYLQYFFKHVTNFFSILNSLKINRTHFHEVFGIFDFGLTRAN